MSLARLSDDTVFDAVHAFTAYWERDFGDVTDHPSDRGGVTKNGVTLKLLKDLEKEGKKVDLNHDGSVNKKDLLLVSPEIAKQIFRHVFWETGRAFCCPPLTAMVYYDFSVNSGSGNAARQLQKAIDALHPGTIVAYAANLGPKTQEALKHFTSKDHSYGVDLSLALQLIVQREDFLRNIVKNDATQKVNLNGWLKRCTALQKLINDQSYVYCGR